MNGCETIYGVTPEQILQSIRMIMEVQEYYKRLSPMAPDEEQADIMDKIISENEVTLLNLKELYFSITCTKSGILSSYTPVIQNYIVGLAQAKAIELRNLAYFLQLWINAADIYFSTTIGSTRTVFGIPANNSYLHAIKMQYVMILYSCT